MSSLDTYLVFLGIVEQLADIVASQYSSLPISAIDEFIHRIESGFRYSQGGNLGCPWLYELKDELDRKM